MAKNNNNFFNKAKSFLNNFGEVSTEFLRNGFKFIPGVGPIVYQNDKHLNGQLVIITGANSGIGKETALQLAKRKAKVSLKYSNILLFIKFLTLR